MNKFGEEGVAWSMRSLNSANLKIIVVSLYVKIFEKLPLSVIVGEDLFIANAEGVVCTINMHNKRNDFQDVTNHLCLWTNVREEWD